MKFVFAAAACAAAVTLVAPAVAQPGTDTINASSFAMSVNKQPVKNVRSIEFNAVQSTGAERSRAAAEAKSFTLKVTLARTTSRTFDDWGARTGALRDLEVSFLDRQGKVVGGYALGGCTVGGWDWTFDATANGAALETWSITCMTSSRT